MSLWAGDVRFDKLHANFELVGNMAFKYLYVQCYMLKIKCHCHLFI